MLTPTPTATIDIAVIERERGSGVGERPVSAPHDWDGGKGAQRVIVDVLAVNHPVDLY
jgi:hypothetical protein